MGSPEPTGSNLCLSCAARWKALGNASLSDASQCSQALDKSASPTRPPQESNAPILPFSAACTRFPPGSLYTGHTTVLGGDTEGSVRTHVDTHILA